VHTFIITFAEISELHSVVVACIECYHAVCNERMYYHVRLELDRP